MIAKISKYLLLPVVLSGIVSQWALAAEVLIDKDVGGIRFARLILTGPITTAALKNLQDHQPASNVLSVIQVFQTKDSSFQRLRGKGATDLDNRAVWYRRYLIDAYKPAPDFGEIVQVGKDVIVRTVQHGSYADLVVSGTNPLICENKIEECSISWIGIGIVPPHQEKLYKRPQVHLFVRTKLLPDVSEAQRLTLLLKKRFNTELLSTSFRTDNWFIEDTDFPIIYPFQPVVQPFELDKVDVSAETMCVSDENGIRCSSLRSIIH